MTSSLCSVVLIIVFCLIILHCLSFNLRLQNTPLVSSNLSFLLHMPMEINVLVWSRHTNVAGLNPFD